MPEALRTVTAASGELSWEWLGGVLPSNLFLAASRGDILPLLLFTIVFGAAASRLPAAERNPIARTVHSLAAAMLTVIRWLLVFTPVGVFALAYGIALATGLKAAGMVGAFIVAVSVPMLLGTLLLYPVASIFGRVSLRAFARAVAPAQLVAVSSRSSIASLPALVDGAKRHLHLGDAATGFVLPLAVSTFKVNRTISATIKVLFLAHVFGTTVPAGKLVVFIVTVIILSFTALGVPGGGSAFKTLPAYLAAGVPIEGVIVLEAVDTIPDIFKTLLNVTGDMAAAVILGRPRAAAGSAALGVTGATAS